MKFFAFIYVLLFSISSISATKYSDYISDLQKTFGDAHPTRKIVYLDRDILNQKFSLKNYSDFEKAQIIEEFIESKSQQKVKTHDAETLLFSIDFNNFSSYPLSDVNDKPICIVVPSNPNFNQIQAHNRMLNWDQLYTKPEYKNKTINKPLTLEVMNKISDLHETFHCLDDQYLPNSQIYDIDHHMIHKSEVFAEIGALIYLAQKGYTQINEKRAQIREVGSRLTKKYSEPNPFNMGPWGAIYSLQFAIRSLDKHLENEIINYWTVNQIIRYSYAITEFEALNTHEFYGISSYFEDPEQIKDLVSKYQNEAPDSYLYKRYNIIDNIIKSYQKNYNKSINQLLTDSEYKELITISNFNLSTDCPDLSKIDDLDSLEVYIDKSRQDHYVINRPDKSTNFLALQNVYSCYQYNLKSR